MKKGLAIFACLFLLVSLSSVSAGLFSKSKITGNAVSLDADGWTPWMNRDGPTGKGDYETITDYITDGKLSKSCSPSLAIECRNAADGNVYDATVAGGNLGEIVVCDNQAGFYCLNEKNPQGCSDYEVRFRCELECDETAGNCETNQTTCTANENINSSSTICVDGVDNDCDGKIDSADSDCVQSTNQTTCTDSDGGINYGMKGDVVTYLRGGSQIYIDYCNSSDILNESYCEGNTPKTLIRDCGMENKVCSNGACVQGTNQTTNVSSGVCSELIDQISNVGSFEENSLQYSAGLKDVQNSTWFLNGNMEEFTEYYSAWHLYYDEGDENSKYGYLHKDVIVFNNESVDVSSILEGQIKNNFCQVHEYNGVGVYVCNWNIYGRGGDIEQNSWKNREILWNNNNVLVRLEIGWGEYLSDEEINLIMEKNTMKFINSLKDNQGKFLGWEDFDIDWPFNYALYSTLEMCPSKVPEDTCSPVWQCITEPAFCPEHGYQTQTCKDYRCDNNDIVTQMPCNPGICSGCLVPKWFDSNSIGDNKCIPYGFRFDNQVGWVFREQTGTESGLLKISDTKDNRGVSLSISPEGVAELSVGGWDENYTFSEGDEVFVDVGDWDESTIELSFVAEEILYDAENYEDSYVLLNFKVVSLGRTIDTVESYCDLDGVVKPQKSKTADGSWEECNDNYECASNVCIEGECQAVNEIISDIKGFRRLGVTLLCRLSHMFNSDNYATCVSDYLEFNPNK